MADEDYAIPIFLINGQLESGKTTFISETIDMGQFDEAQKKLLIVCEEGEEEYDEKLLRENAVSLVTLDKDEFTPEKLQQLDKQYDPWVVIVEYNGMWDPKLIEEIAKPRGWEIYQTITLMDAGMFQVQWQNMKSIMAESVKRADMVIFNRCKKGMNLGSFRRSMRALNGNLQVIFEDENGDQVAISEQLPYDTDQDVITVDDDDYGIWYMDVNDRPEIYKGKTVKIKGQALKNRQFKKNIFVPGRKVMTCCAADMQFIGYIADYDKADELENKQWYMVTAKIDYAFRPEYRKKGPVLHCISVEKAEPPKNEIVSF